MHSLLQDCVFCPLGCLKQLRFCILAITFQAALARRVPCDPALPGSALAASVCLLFDEEVTHYAPPLQHDAGDAPIVKMVNGDTVHSNAMGPLLKYPEIFTEVNCVFWRLLVVLSTH